MELTDEDIAYILEVALLCNQKKPLTELISQIKSKHILIGKETLEFIRSRW